MSRTILETGRRFTRLVVLGPGETVKKRTQWRCLCDCGSVVEVRTDHLLRGNTGSCGCFLRDVLLATTPPSQRTHGMSASVEYRVWRHAIARCHNPRDSNYHNYGARGITVCERWRASFVNFLEDMGHRPPGRMSLERVDNDSGYSKENCIWATAAAQARNSRNTKLNTEAAKVIRHLAKKGIKVSLLARLYRTSPRNARSVVACKIWWDGNHVGGNHANV